MDEQNGNPLFQGVVFTVIPSDELEMEQAMLDALTQNGAQHVPLRSSDNEIEDLDEITHIISSHVDFPQYSDALEQGISVVKPSWVALSVKKSRMASPRQHSPDPSQFFHDVVLTCGTLPEGDKDAIIAGVLVLGGQYSPPLTKLVTHIVTTDMDNEKIRVVQDKGLDCKIVLPHWFDHCMRLGKKINERPYMFPNPTYLQTAPITGTVKGPSSEAVDGASAARPTDSFLKSPPTSPQSPSSTRKGLTAFGGKKVMFSEDLNLSDHLMDTLEKLVDQGRGSLTTDIEDADIYICHYRSGEDYVAASRGSKEVANLSWLFHVINRNKYTNPLTRLLHYPVPLEGLGGFEHMKISVSNYTGEARIYLENLIRECGAEFTKTMKQDNTHLITAHEKSEKVDAAKEWNINIVNHLWLEESYAKCAVQTLSNPRYTTFPSRTNLSEIVGQTTLDMKKIEQMFFPKSQLPQKSSRAVSTTSAAKTSPRKTVPVSSAMPSGSPRQVQKKPAPPPITEDAETEDEEEVDEPEPEPETTKKPRGRPSKTAVATPRPRDDEKENESPLAMSTGRASKAKALNTMHKQADDIALFQKEMKRKGGVLHGGRRSSLADESASTAAEKKKGKRKSDEATYDVTAEGEDLSDGETQDRPAKAAKKAKLDLPPVLHRVMVTGYEKWVGNKKAEDVDKAKLRQLGIQLTQDPKQVDILVAPKILRTRKFVGALASAPLVVDTKYLDTALKQNKLVSKPTLLHDRDSEERNGFKLVDSLERAKTNQGKLFRGWSIFVMAEIAGGFDTFKEIITLNGGNAFSYSGRTGINIEARRNRHDPAAGSESQNQGDDDEFDVIYLVSGETDGERQLWKKFKDLVKKQDLEPRIVKSDWLLLAAMGQEIRWDAKWEHRGS